MIPESLQDQFEKFKSDIKPSSTTKANSQQAHENLRAYLRDHETYKDYHVETHLAGSYKRHTAIRPRSQDGETERPDIDILVTTTHTLEDDPQEVLDQLRDVLAQRYKDVSKRSRSVHVSASLAEMDVVPIIAPYGDDGPYLSSGS